MSQRKAPLRIKLEQEDGTLLEAIRRPDLDRVGPLAGLYEVRGGDGPRFYRLVPGGPKARAIEVTEESRAVLTGRLERARLEERRRRQADSVRRGGKERPSPEPGARVKPTPETVAKRQVDAVSKLLAEGRIGEEELRAADEIERVFTAVSAGLFARARALDEAAKAPGSGKRPEMAAWLARAYRDNYKPWADRLGRLHREEKYPPILAITIASHINGDGLRNIERSLHLQNGTAARAIAVALELYAVMAGWRTPRRMLIQCTAALPRLERLVQPALCALCGPLDCRRSRGSKLVTRGVSSVPPWRGP
ncbi:MAG: hypothetical protein HYR63_00380 [Proteobacteria bacterium]|nr:hypothetical protein [Pseudomonadota bacterium]